MKEAGLVFLQVEVGGAQNHLNSEGETGPSFLIAKKKKKKEKL